MNKDKGLYQLVLYLEKGQNVQVGKAGEFFFAQGYYVYTGSAQRGLRARVSRHISKNKRLHWHIDYLLKLAMCVAHRSYIGSTNECQLSMKTQQIEGARTPIKGFGATDCGCISHLTYFSRWEEVVQIYTTL